MKKEQETSEKADSLGLKVITGGKDGHGEDWLAKLEVNTYFLARPRATPAGDPFTGFTLLEFIAGGWQGRARIIVQEDPNSGAQQVLSVDSARFSSTMELFDTLEGPSGEPDENDPE